MLPMDFARPFIYPVVTIVAPK